MNTNSHSVNINSHSKIRFFNVNGYLSNCFIITVLGSASDFRSASSADLGSLCDIQLVDWASIYRAKWLCIAITTIERNSTAFNFQRCYKDSHMTSHEFLICQPLP